MILCIFTGMISWRVVYSGLRVYATRPNDSNACEVFRVGATDEEDKEGATCACDAVGWDGQRGNNAVVMDQGDGS